MLRRPRRSLSLLVPALLMAGLVAGCGSSKSSDPFGPTVSGMDAVTVTGDVGVAPTVVWKSAMSASTAQTTTLHTGDGAALATGDKVLVNYWLGDGLTKQNGLVTTYGADTPPLEVTVGTAPVAQPSTGVDLLSDVVSTYVKPGVTEGTRLAVTVSADNLLGAQNALAPDLTAVNLGNYDPVLVIIDVQDKVLGAPAGAQQPNPSWAPHLQFDKADVPTSFDFTGVPALGSKLKVGVLKKGTGPVVKKGDGIVVNYLGQVYKGAKPFDQSYGKTPFSTPIGEAKVVKGWDQGLVGLTVGSRVILGIPPALGYGTKGQPPTIPGDSTLYFVIDILGAA